MEHSSTETIVLNQARVHKLGANLACIEIKGDADLEIKDIEEIFEAREKLFGHSSYKILTIAGRYSNISKEARELAGSEKYMSRITALGIVVHSLGNRLIGNFFIKVKKTSTPSRLFSTEEEALAWLGKFAS